MAAAGVQSLARAAGLVDALARAGGSASLAELTGATGLSAPTAHRLLATLVDLGWARHAPGRRYALGATLVRLGDVAGRSLGASARAELAALVAATGETANLAVREGDCAVYVAQSPSAHAMRMFTEVGARVALHSTGVGKAMLAQGPDTAVRELADRVGLVAATEHTITTVDLLLADLDESRRRGFAIDDHEHELGVRCVAVATTLHGVPAAVSVSGPAARMTDERLRELAPSVIAAGVAIRRLAVGDLSAR